MVAIFVQSSTRSPSLGDDLLQTIATDLAHMLLYGLLACLIMKSLPGSPRAAFYAVAGAIAYGITDEIHQTFVPERTASFLDLIFDSIGATVGVMALTRLDEWRQKQPASKSKRRRR